MRVLFSVLLLGSLATAATFQAKVVERGDRIETYSDTKTIPAWTGWHQTTKSFDVREKVPYLRLQTPDREFVVNATRLKKRMPELGAVLLIDNAKKGRLVVTIGDKHYDCPIQAERLLGKENDPLGIR